MANGGSAWVGASAWKNATFWKVCTTAMNICEVHSERGAHDVDPTPATL